jgi:monoamine oxidase
MARSRHGRLLERLRGVHDLSVATGIPVDEINDQLAEAGRIPGPRNDPDRALDRRAFLRRGGLAAGLLLTAPAALAACTRSETGASSPPMPTRSATPGGDTPRIVIVGAGLSGATTAYRLAQAGIASTIYEASERPFGRSWTMTDFFDDGQISEHGGEFINSDHTAIIKLAEELGLGIDDLTEFYPPGAEYIWIGGGRYRYSAIQEDFEAVYPAIKRDAKAAHFPVRWNRQNPKAAALDQTPMSGWIEENVPGGIASRFGTFMALTYIGEYGLDPENQSTLNLLDEARASDTANMMLVGDQDYLYQISGGNGRVVETLVNEKLPPDTVNYNSPLVAIRANDDRTVTCTFQQGRSTNDVVADQVVLCLPFTALRRVDLTEAGFDARKISVVENLGMGTNSKVHLQFKDRTWYDMGSEGTTISDTGYQQTWETDQGSKAPTGLLVNYTGGAVGAGYPVTEAHAPAPTEVSGTALEQMDPVLPGLGKAFNGKAYLDCWARDEWHFGSYACFLPGQYTSINGMQAVPQGSIHFAGEATSEEFQGFLTGAVQSANRVAKQVLDALGVRQP